MIARGKDFGDIHLNKYKEWQEKATLYGKELKEKPVKEEAAIDSTCDRQMATGMQVQKASENAMHRPAINMERKRKMEKG